MGNFDKRRTQSGQAHQEGRNHRQVRHPVRCFPEEDRQEDGGLSALQVRLHLLWQGEHEEDGRRYLEIFLLQYALRYSVMARFCQILSLLSASIYLHLSFVSFCSFVNCYCVLLCFKSCVINVPVYKCCCQSQISANTCPC